MSNTFTAMIPKSVYTHTILVHLITYSKKLEIGIAAVKDLDDLGVSKDVFDCIGHMRSYPDHIDHIVFAEG